MITSTLVIGNPPDKELTGEYRFLNNRYIVFSIKVGES